MTWFDFFDVEPDESFIGRRIYIRSENVSEKEAEKIAREEMLLFQESIITLRDHHGLNFMDLPPPSGPERTKWYRVHTNIIGPTGIPGRDFV